MSEQPTASANVTAQEFFAKLAQQNKALWAGIAAFLEEALANSFKVNVPATPAEPTGPGDQALDMKDLADGGYKHHLQSSVITQEQIETLYTGMGNGMVDLQVLNFALGAVMAIHP